MKLSNFGVHRRWVLLGTLGIVMVAPAVGELATAQAKPPSWAGGPKHHAPTQIFTGVVIRDLGGDHFQMRTNWNQVLNVDLVGPAREPARLSAGDRVEVRGDRNGNKIRANGVRILDDRNPGKPGRPPRHGQHKNTLIGQVTRDLRGNNFEVRGSDGRRYEVVLNYNEPRRLSAGDRVLVLGDLEGRTFYGEKVRIVNNTDNYGRYGNGQTANFAGRVTDVRSNNVILVRADNGRTYQVRSRDVLPRRLNDGSRVRIIGQIEGNVVYVNKVDLI
jgi:translation initiation factor IF-1